MTLNDDLAAWGEPPADPREQARADLLDRVLEKLQGRVPTQPVMSPAAAREAAEHEEALLRDLALLHRHAAVFQRSSGALDDSRTRLTDTLERDEAPPPPVSNPLPDPFPGEYRILKRLGQGAFGTVWLAEDLNLGWQVALKTLRLAGSADTSDEKLLALRHEARTLAQLRHPNIVQVHAWRQAGDEHYLVLQCVAGGSLEDRVRKAGPLLWSDAARYIADVGEGLLEVHARGIVHRDIKPANILWQPDPDEALLTDFGVAARLADRARMAGTPVYMPPEAFDGRITPAVDVYSLAATLFWLVTGRFPFEPGQHSDLFALIDDLVDQIEQGLPEPDPRCEGLPQRLEAVLRSGLAADPARRPSLADFVTTLRGSLNQSLADSLTLPPGATPQPAPVDLRLVVSRQVGPDTYQPVAATHPQPDRLKRNMKKVPRLPQQVRLRTGDRVRIEVSADRAGFVTVFNVGPTGDLNLLYPEETPTAASPPNIQAHQPLHVVDVEMEPPTGRERLFALWTRQPLPLSPEQLQDLAAQGAVPGSSPYRATRNMVRVKQSVQRLHPEDWHAVVLEVDHGE
jgi:serine/threonine protein kinase